MPDRAMMDRAHRTTRRRVRLSMPRPLQRIIATRLTGFLAGLRGLEWRSTVVRTFAFWSLLLMASLGSLLAPIDRWLFDNFIRIAPVSADTPSVALVQYDADQVWGGAGAAPSALARARTFAEALQRAGARQVVLLRPASQLSPLALDPDGGCRPPAVHGIARTLPLFDADGQPCLITRLGRHLNLPLPEGERISPDFMIATATALPRLRMDPVPSPALIQQVVQGRVVLLYPGFDTAVYVTPLYAVDGLMESSLLHALTLDALLKEKAVRWAATGADVLLALLVVALLQFGLRGARYRVAMAVAWLAALPVLALSGALLFWGDYYLPASASLIALAGFALRTLVRRNAALGQTLVDLDHSLTGLVQQPLGRAFHQDGADNWSQANQFVFQFFELERSMMFELPSGSVHLGLVDALGCSAGDVIERRRDYRRAPFSSALAKARPAPPTRPFLAPQPGFLDFIAPLVAAEQVVGFWCFSVRERPGSELESLTHDLARYAEELAKVILRSGQSPGRGEVVWTRSPTLAQLRSRLFDGAKQAREQLGAYRDMFVAFGHPVAVTDLFGRIQFANPRFEELALSVDKPLMAMSLHNMLTDLCGLSSRAAKDALRAVVLHDGREEAGLPLRGLAPYSLQYVLHVRSVRRDSRTDAAAGAPFEVLGMIVEISPGVLEADAAVQQGQKALEYTRNMCALLEESLLAVDGLPGAGATPLREHLRVALDQTRQVRQELQDTVVHVGSPLAPLDLQQMLQKLQQLHETQARAKNVRFEVAVDGPCVVHVHSEHLRAALSDALELLVDDAGPNTSIAIRLHASDDGTMVVANLSNDGYGLPEWHVLDVMRSSPRRNVEVTSALERLALSRAALDPSVSFQLRSELGRGYEIQVAVPREAGVPRP